MGYKCVLSIGKYHNAKTWGTLAKGRVVKGIQSLDDLIDSATSW